MSDRRKPLLSLVVACWNSERLLARFLASLAEQTFQDWELLLLDNASSDGSAALVADHCRRHPGQRVRWMSRPDGGIYHAWNHGLGQAQGEYLSFIGTDDTFVGPNSLGTMAGLTATGADLITARNAYYAADGRYLRAWGSGWNWRRQRQSMTIAHPGMLIRRALFERFGAFDAGFRICGDYEWLLRLPQGLRSVHSSDVILKVVQAGVSHTRIAAVYRETFRAQCRHMGMGWSAACWVLNWLQYGRRRCIGLA